MSVPVAVTDGVAVVLVAAKAIHRSEPRQRKPFLHRLVHALDP